MSTDHWFLNFLQGLGERAERAYRERIIDILGQPDLDLECYRAQCKEFFGCLIASAIFVGFLWSGVCVALCWLAMR